MYVLWLMLLYIVDTSMRRNMCVAFVPLVPHHHVQVQLFLFSDHRSSLLPQTISFLSFKPYFPFVPLVEFINQPHPLLAICGTVVVVCTPPFYMVDCCMFCFVLLLHVVLSTSCYELNIISYMHDTSTRYLCVIACYQFCKLMQCCLLGRFSCFCQS